MPRALRQGRQVFWIMAATGLFPLVYGLTSFSGGAWREGLGMLLTGAGMLTGSGGTLLLSYGKVEGDDVFPLQIAIRIGFMLIGPGAVLMELPYLLQEIGWGACLAGCAATVVPFGTAILILLYRKKQKDREP